MLHWPDSMFTYLTGQNILFSKAINDGIREMWNPDEMALERCRDFGKNIK
jgi:flavorubredoxin